MLQYLRQRKIGEPPALLIRGPSTERFPKPGDRMRKGLLLLLLFVIGFPVMAQHARGKERNKQIARSFFEEVLDQGRFDQYAASHATDFVAHAGDHEATLAEDIAAAKEERKALPDMKVSVNQILAERDLVAVYWTVSGTNTGAGDRKSTRL